MPLLRFIRNKSKKAAWPHSFLRLTIRRTQRFPSINTPRGDWQEFARRCRTDPRGYLDTQFGRNLGAKPYLKAHKSGRGW